MLNPFDLSLLLFRPALESNPFLFLICFRFRSAVIFTLSLTGSRLVPHHHRTFSIRRCVCVFFFLYPFIRKTSNSMCKLLYCFLVVVAVDCWYRCWCWCCWWCCCCMSSFGSIFHTSLFLYLWALILSNSKQPKTELIKWNTCMSTCFANCFLTLVDVHRVYLCARALAHISVSIKCAL